MQLDAQVLEGELWETLGNVVDGSSSAGEWLVTVVFEPYMKSDF